MSSLENKLALGLEQAGVNYVQRATKHFGRPDFLVNHEKCAIFVHGCFWHGHACQTWKTNDLWKSKVSAIMSRDSEVRSYYANSKIKYFRVWECELNTFGASTIVNKIKRFVSCR